MTVLKAIFRTVLLLCLALQSARLDAASEGPEIRELARLLSPTVIEKLDEDAFKARFLIILAYLERTRIQQGFHIEEQVDRALALKNYTRQEAALIRESLVDSYRIAADWHLFDGEQKEQMSNGEPVTIQFGRFKGQTCEVGYLIPPDADPRLERELANLRLTTTGETPDSNATRRVAEQLAAIHSQEKAQKSSRRSEVAADSRSEAKQWEKAIKETGPIENAPTFLDLVVRLVESTSRENEQRVKIAIGVSNRSRVPVAATVEWFFLGRSPEEGVKFIAGKGSRAVRLVPSDEEAWEAKSDSFTSYELKRVALRLDEQKVPSKASALRKVDKIPFHGWIVRVVREDKILAVKGSTPELAKLAQEKDAFDEMRVVRD